MSAFVWFDDLDDLHVQPQPCASGDVSPRDMLARLSEGLCPGCASRLTIKGAYGYCPATPDRGLGWRYDGNANVVNVAVTHDPVP